VLPGLFAVLAQKKKVNGRTKERFSEYEGGFSETDNGLKALRRMLDLRFQDKGLFSTGIWIDRF